MTFGYRPLGNENEQCYLWGLDNKENGIWRLDRISKLLNMELEDLIRIIRENKGELSFNSWKEPMATFKSWDNLVNICKILEPHLIMLSITE